MKDILSDIIANAGSIAGVERIKVIGTPTKTTVSAIGENQSVVMVGEFKTPVKKFEGTFGMPNLNILRTILGFDEYDEKSNITVERKTSTSDPKETYPSSITFTNEQGDFYNEYRLMAPELINSLVPNASFKGAVWNVSFVPTVNGIQRLKKQSQACNSETSFSYKLVNNELKVYLGDQSTHSANFTFQNNVTGTLNKTWNWPVKQFLAIMDLTGDKTIKVSDKGATEITVDSGLCNYTFWLVAQTK